MFKADWFPYFIQPDADISDADMKHSQRKFFQVPQ